MSGDRVEYERPNGGRTVIESVTDPSHRKRLCDACGTREGERRSVRIEFRGVTMSLIVLCDECRELIGTPGRLFPKE